MTVGRGYGRKSNHRYPASNLRRRIGGHGCLQAHRFLVLLFMPFDSFLGNKAAVETVREMLRASRLPGSLLFTGPDGVGKRTLALMLAKASVCERLKDDFCGDCARCRRADDMIAAATEHLAR